jgi:hypothetical protein
MARKAWADLTPAYRARLERAGISATAHAKGRPLEAARGHGSQTPVEIARAMTRAAPRAISLDRFLERAAGTGWSISRTEAADGFDELGGSRAVLLLNWHRYQQAQVAAGTAGSAAQRRHPDQEIPDVITFGEWMTMVYDGQYDDDDDLWRFVEDHDQVGDPWMRRY